MAVEASDRQGDTARRCSAASSRHPDARPDGQLEGRPEGVAGWLRWLQALLPACSWMAIVEPVFTHTDGSAESRQSAPRMHTWPPDAKTPPAAMLVARKAQASGRVTSVQLNEQSTHSAILLAMPLGQPAQPGRVLVMTTTPLSAAERAAHISLCRWASVWLADTESLREPLPPGAQTPEFPLDNPPVELVLAGSVLLALQQHSNATAVAIALVNALKREYACERVSLAVRRPGSRRLSLLAMSDQSRVDTRKTLPGLLLAAMSECLPSAQPRRVSQTTLNALMQEYPAGCSLFTDQGCMPSMSCVIRPAGTASVVLLLERAPAKSFTPAEQDALPEQVASSCALVSLCLSQQAGPVARCLESVHRWMRPDGTGVSRRRHVLAASLFLLGACVLLLPVQQSVSARARIEARDLQVLMAPQSGIVATSHVRAGDSVKRGQLLASLDDRDLVLAASKWRSESVKNDQARDQALASGDRVEVGRLRADAQRIAAEEALIERQLQRSRLRAPFDGVVLSGDLSQQLGASVAQGDTLFTVGSSDAFRLILDVDERDVGLIRTGQQVRVRMAALPERTWQAQVESVLPVAASSRQGNVFRVPAVLDLPGEVLRPGMEGVAKLDAGTGALGWVYTRRMRTTLQTWAWHLGLLR